MPEGFHPAPDDATHGVRREDVPAEVRDYVDNLELQLDAIVARHGIASFRDAMRIPDAERHERLEAVMDLKDLERYVELIGKYRDSVMKRRIPTADLGWRDAEAGRPFKFDKEKAAELGFAEMTIEARPKAQELVDAVYDRDPRFVESFDADGNAVMNDAAVKQFWAANCDELPDVPAKSPSFFKWIAEHRLSEAIDGDDPATATSSSRPHVPRFGSPGFVLAMDWAEFDHDNDAEKAAAMTPQTKAVMRRLFGTEDVTNVSRVTVNSALWADHDARVPSARALEITRELVPDADPSNYELRLTRYDEYARVAESRGYGKKNLWTWFDGYVGLWDGIRYGMNGGDRDNGGAAHFDLDLRGRGPGHTAVRLVLSRK